VPATTNDDNQTKPAAPLRVVRARLTRCHDLRRWRWRFDVFRGEVAYIFARTADLPIIAFFLSAPPRAYPSLLSHGDLDRFARFDRATYRAYDFGFPVRPSFIVVFAAVIPLYTVHH
jgi:hypothetical protein